jgi:hypothetical protein
MLQSAGRSTSLRNMLGHRQITWRTGIAKNEDPGLNVAHSPVIRKPCSQARTNAEAVAIVRNVQRELRNA